ncbi:DNA-binding protein [Halorarius litoreus]|uniref:DNA-binding protein n=1 Tax=Halorarius litoreus TaxID=2962676 RepID=UPI0020CF1E9C|nr:DNA-binding protein [Halorarius litoreus]
MDERPELRPTVKLRSQAKIDSEAIAKVDGTAERDHPYGMTLEAEEKWEAREMEKRRTRARRQTQSSMREQGSRVSAARGAEQKRRAFDERAASVDPWLHPESGDPREELERDELAAVNQQAQRITQEVRDTSTRAAVSRQLAERVADGGTVLGASVAVMEAERTRPGSVVPIGMLEEVSRQEVSIEGTVEVLWESNHPAIAQVGLLEDEGERVKFTSWTKSRVPTVEVGDEVRMRAVAKNWYQGRVSVALTGDSRIVFLNNA